MAQSNVAREPSMDEILASIRKIIESNEPGIPGFAANDSGRGNDGGFGANAAYETESAEEIHLTIDDDVLVAEFDAELGQRSFEQPVRDMPVETPKASAPAQTPPLSLADVAARVRAASERNTYMAREPQAASVAAEQPSDSPLVTSRMSPAASVKAAAVPAEPVAAGKASETVADVSATAKQDAPVDSEMTSQPAAERADAHAASVATFAEKEIATILSPEVGQQVAKSFDNLAFALDSSARRSFDEIAEDMLRPMLQEWLDDNLPTLVERLVREEIERVARGPRR